MNSHDIITADECKQVKERQKFLKSTYKLLDKLITLSNALGHNRLRLSRNIPTRNRFNAYDYQLSQKEEKDLFYYDKMDYWIDYLEQRGYIVDANYLLKKFEIKW